MANNTIKGTIPESEKKRISAQRSSTASGTGTRKTVKGTVSQDDAKRIKTNSINSRIKKLYEDYANDAAERAKFATGAKSTYDEYDKYQAPGLRFSSDRFRDEATEIKSYIEKNRQFLSDEDYNSAMESVNSFIDTDFTDSDNNFNDIYEAVQYYGGYDKYSEAVEKYRKHEATLKKAGLNKNSTYAQIESVVNDTSTDAGAGPLEQAQGRVYKDRRLSSEEKDYLSSLLLTEEKVATMTDDEVLARIQRHKEEKNNIDTDPNSDYYKSIDYRHYLTNKYGITNTETDPYTQIKEKVKKDGGAQSDADALYAELTNQSGEDWQKYSWLSSYDSDTSRRSDFVEVQDDTSGTAYYYTDEYGNATAMTWENLPYERKVGNAYKSVTDEKSDNYNPEAAEIYNRLRELDNEKVNLDATRDEEAVNNWISENDTLKKQFEELTGTTFDAVEYYNVRVKSKERSEKFKNTIESAMQYVDDLPDWANAVIGAATGNPVQLTTNAVKAVSGAVDKDGWVYNAADVADTVAQAAFMYPSVEGAAMVLAIPGAILSGGEYLADLAASIGHTDATDPNTYRPINIYDDYARMSNETLIGTASGNIQDKLREYGWSEGAIRLATDVYGGVASGLNSIVIVGGSCALFGPAVGQVVASVILSGSAASSATAEAVQNGSTTGEALTYGFLAGCAEYIGEKISLGYFFDNIVNGTMSYKGLRNIMKSFGKTLLGGVVEGSEEVFTDFMNRLSDYAVNADHSQLENAKQMYMRQGLSEEEAKEAAIKDWWKQVGSDFIGGFVGGLLMSGASFGANTVISAGQSIQERKIKESLGRALLDSEYEDEQGAKTNAEQTEENSDGTPGEKKISGAEKALRTANEVLAEGSPYREDAELVQLAERVIEKSKKGKLSSKNKAASRLIAEFTAKGNAVEEKLLTEELDKSAARNEKAVQGEGTAESAAANSQQEKYIAPAGRDSSRVSTYDGKIIYVSGKQGGESESMDLAMSLALTSAAEARDAFGIISPRAVQEIGDAYTGDISGVEEYAEQALMAYALGYMGNSLEDTVATVSNMESGARQTAWEQGVKDADAFYNERDAEIRSAAAEAQKPGVFTNRRGNTDTSEIQHLMDNKALSEEQTRFIDTVRKLSEIFGLDFEFYASEVDENGQRHGDAGYIDDSGKIHIDIFAGQEKSAFIARDSTLTSTLLHELTHFIHDWSPKAWKEMYNYVVARYSPYGSVQAALEAIRAREKLEGREISDDLAQDEFMAQCCEALFEDEAGMRDFAAKHKNTAQKIVEWLENVLEKISGINMGHSESDIAAVISQWQDGIEELREKWLAALEDAANNKNAAEGVLQSSAKTEGKEETRKSRGERDSAVSENSEENKNHRYSENRPFLEDDIEEYMRTGKKLHTRNNKYRMLKEGKKPYLTTSRETKQFIRKVIHGESSGDVSAFARVGSKLSDEISQIYHVDLYGRFIELNADLLRESYKKHINAKEKGDIDLSDEDFESIPELLNSNPTALYYNKYKGKIEVCFSVRSKNGYILILTVVSSERNSIQVTKVYGNSVEKFENRYGKKIRKSAGSLEGQKASNPYKAVQYADSTLSNGIIPQDGVKSQEESEKNSSTENGNVRYSRSFRNAVINKEIIALVQKVKSGSYKQNEFVSLGVVSDEIASLIKRETGVDVTGYEMKIEARQLMHIIIDHGENGKADQSMKDDKDIAKMEYVIKDPDDVKYGGKSKSYWYNKYGHNKTAPTVKYEKDIGDRIYYVIQAVPEAKAKCLYIVTAYMRNKNRGILTSTNAQGPVETSDNVGLNTSNNNIPNDSEVVKTETEKNPSTESDNKRSSRSKRDEKSAAAVEAEAKAGEIAKKWGLSKKKTEALGRGLTNIFESVGGEEVDMAFVRQQAESLAAKTANGMISQDMPADISDKLSFLRSFGALNLTEEQRNAAAKLAGTFKEYRSRISSAVKIGEKGEALSTAWEKLSEQMPELFPADTAESDMARVMLQNVSRLLADERAYRMEGDELTEARESLQREIYDAANQYIQYNRVTSGQTEIKLKNVVPRPSVRAVLAEAALKTAKTEEERAALTEYKLNLETVNDMEAERDREYSKLLSMLPKSGFSTFTNEEIEAQRKVVEKLEKQISNADRVLKKSALAQPLQQLADREIRAQREALQKAAREERTEALAAMRERYRQRDVMDKLRRIMDRARRSVVNPNSKNYILGQFVEPMEKLIEAIDPGPAMFNKDGETTEKYKEYDRKRRTCLEQLSEMKRLLGIEKKNTEDAAAANEAEKKSKKKSDKKPSRIDNAKLISIDEANSVVSALQEMIGEKALGEMSSGELQVIYENVRDFMNNLRSAERQVGLFEGKTNNEAGQELINEAERFEKSFGAKHLKMFSDYVNPIRLMQQLGGYDENSYWYKYIVSLNEGRKKSGKWYQDQNEPFDKLRANAKEYQNFSRKIEDSGLKDEKGNPVFMTHSTMALLVMSIERELNSKKITHIKKGGVWIPNAKLMLKGKWKEACNTSHAQLIKFEFKTDDKAAFTQSSKVWLIQMKETLESKLNDYDRQWMGATRNFFSVASKDAINTTFMILGHKVLATENFYIPFSVMADFLHMQYEGLKFDESLLSAGFLKDITPEAPQPIVISGLENVVMKHMDRTAKIYGLAVPLRDFKAAYNVAIGNTSVQHSLNNDITGNVIKVIDNLVTDLESHRREVDDAEHRKNLFRTLMGNFVSSALNGNVTVSVRQFMSYPTAAEVVSAKALSKAVKKLPRYLFHCKEVYAEIDAHTCLHSERRRGMSIPELRSMNNILSRFADRKRIPQGVRNKIDPTKWIQSIDVATTALIWEACKIDIESQGIEVGTEEYWDAVTALYEKALEETQPMYDPLHRAEITKTTNPVMKMWYMFKTQPLQNFGIVYTSANRTVAALVEYNTAKKNGNAEEIKAAKEKASAAGKHLLRSLMSQTLSLVMFSVMGFLGKALLGKVDWYRDDDDELTAESVGKRLAWDMFENAMANYVPFWFLQEFPQVIEKFYAYFAKGEDLRFDDVNIPLIEKISGIGGDLADAWNRAGDIPEKGFKPFLESVGYLSFDMCDIFTGLPANNLYNLFYGVYSNIKGLFTDGWDWQNEKDEYNTASGVKKALNAGKEEKAAERADAYIDSRVEAAMSDGEAEITEEQAREDAEKALRSSVAGSYKEGYKASYIEAIFDEDETAAAEIEDTLEGLGIGFDETIFADWRQQAEDAMLEYDSYGDYVKGKGKLKYTVSGVKSAIDTGKTDDAQKRFKEAVDKKLRDIQKKDGKISSSKAKKQAETEVRNSVGSSYKAEWIKLMWQGYYEEADEIQRKLRKVSGVFDNEYFRGWNQKLKELKKEYSSYEEYEESK